MAFISYRGMKAPYISSFHRVLSTTMMSTDVSQVGVALFPSFYNCNFVSGLGFEEDSSNLMRAVGCYFEKYFVSGLGFEEDSSNLMRAVGCYFIEKYFIYCFLPELYLYILLIR